MSEKIHPLGTPQTLPLKSIKPHGKNPRKITNKAVEITAKSIKRFGWQQPLIVDKNHIIIAGHTRYQAAQYLQLTSVPVIVADNLTESEADAFRIADNRTSDYTTWDFTELVDQLEDLADDFSDELGLADWQGILNQFDEINAETGELEEIADLSLNETTDDMLKMSHALTVVCRTEEDKKEIEKLLIEREEVIDVRYKR